MPVRDRQTPPNDWAKLIYELISRPGWSQARLAQEAQVNRNTIRRWVSGESANISAASIRLIAEAAGIDQDVAARSAMGAQQQLRAEDDRAVRMILDSDAPDHIKNELIAHVRSKRQESEDSLMRDIEFRLGYPRPQHGG
jgi:transcriptional regulator with XRE-family HTH domain